MKKTKIIIYAIIFICLNVLVTSLVFYGNDLNDEVLLNNYEQTKSNINMLNNIIDDVVIEHENTLRLKTFDENGFSYDIDNSQDNILITFELKELTTWKKSYRYLGKVILDNNYNIIKESYSVVEENLETYEEYAENMAKRLVKVAIFTGFFVSLISTYVIYITIDIIVGLFKDLKTNIIKKKRK